MRLLKSILLATLAAAVWTLIRRIREEGRGDTVVGRFEEVTIPRTRSRVAFPEEPSIPPPRA